MSIPKVLKVFLRVDQRLFAELSWLIVTLITECYSTAAAKPISISIAAVATCLSFDDSLRFNPAFHSLIPEGGFHLDDQCYYLSIHDTASASLRQVANTFRKWKP